MRSQLVTVINSSFCHLTPFRIHSDNQNGKASHFEWKLAERTWKFRQQRNTIT